MNYFELVLDVRYSDFEDMPFLSFLIGISNGNQFIIGTNGCEVNHVTSWNLSSILFSIRDPPATHSRRSKSDSMATSYKC